MEVFINDLIEEYKKEYHKIFNCYPDVGHLFTKDGLEFINPITFTSKKEVQVLTDKRRTPLINLNETIKSGDYVDGLIVLIKLIRRLKLGEGISEFKRIQNATRFFENFRCLVNFVNLEPRADEEVHEAYIEAEGYIFRNEKKSTGKTKPEFPVVNDETGDTQGEEEGEEQVAEQVDEKVSKNDEDNIELIIEDDNEVNSGLPEKFIFVSKTSDVCKNPSG